MRHRRFMKSISLNSTKRIKSPLRLSKCTLLILRGLYKIINQFALLFLDCMNANNKPFYLSLALKIGYKIVL